MMKDLAKYFIIHVSSCGDGQTLLASAFTCIKFKTFVGKS